jgi:antirestriction protein ArdC
MSKVNVYEIVTNRIMDTLKAGTIPWARPWSANTTPVNWVTQKPYRGINLWLLETGEYATFKQVTDAGGKVKKGEKSQIVVYWQMLKVEEKDEKNQTVIKTIPLLKYYNVFNVATQCEGIEPKRQPEKTEEVNSNELAELLLSKYTNGPKVRHVQQEHAYYQPSLDSVTMPKKTQFNTSEGYYSVLFHELIHSTGHASRLNRDGITKLASFGSATYSKEELVAELGASMLCGMANILDYTIQNSASYIEGWLSALKNDNKLLISASSQAEKAVKHFLGEE